MKKLLLSLMAVLLSTGINAQGIVKSKGEVGFVKAPAAVQSMNKAPKAKGWENNQRIIGPYSSDTYSTYGLGLINYPGTYPVGVFLTDGFQQYEGCSLTKIRFALSDYATVNNVFIKTVDAYGNVYDVAQQEFSGTAQVGWNLVTFENPVTLDFTGIIGVILGYEYVQTSSNYPLSCVDEGDVCPTFIYGNLGAQGIGWYDLGTDSYGSLSVQGIVESDNFSDNAAQPFDFGSFTILANGMKEVPVKVANLGIGITSVDYTVIYDGVQGEELHYDLPKQISGIGGSFVMNVHFVGIGEPGSHDVAVKITKVNGVENGANKDMAIGTMMVLSTSFPKGLVVEEFTGTGCGWCPRGLVGMEKLREAYGNQFIGIGIHQYNKTDAMYNASYADLGFTGAPSCALARKIMIDPYYGSNYSILDDAATEIDNLPFMGISVTGEYNEDKTEVTATATVEPLVSGRCEIFFVLIADGLTGTTSAWRQTNYYSAAYADQTGFSKNDYPEDLQFLWDLGSGYYPVFNDVMIGSSYVGTSNKATIDDITEGVTATSTYTMSMPTKAALKNAIDYDKVAVAAIITDYSSGAVINACKFYLGADEIMELNGNAKNAYVVARYNAAGQVINGPQKGLNIIKMSNGETRKVVLE